MIISAEITYNGRTEAFHIKEIQRKDEWPHPRVNETEVGYLYFDNTLQIPNWVMKFYKVPQPEVFMKASKKLKELKQRN